jgi:hypothetical protein
MLEGRERRIEAAGRIGGGRLGVALSGRRCLGGFCYWRVVENFF